MTSSQCCSCQAVALQSATGSPLKKRNKNIKGPLGNDKDPHYITLNIMVTKAYGTLRLCNDSWKLDMHSWVDSYLMTQVDELTECLDKARSIPTLDLTKGCHPQHKKQPSANQMDCGSSDFSLLACKRDPPTYKHIKKCLALPQKQYSMQLLA